MRRKSRQDREAELEATTDRAHSVADLALERTAAELAAGTSGRPGRRARNAVVFGVASDKLRAIQEPPEPVEIHGRDGREILRGIVRRIPGLFLQVRPDGDKRRDQQPAEGYGEEFVMG